MDKNKLARQFFLDKSNIALVCIIGMFLGFLVSRAVLSISMVLFAVNSFRGFEVKNIKKYKWWLLSLSWLGLLTVSYFWSGDKGFWGHHLEMKLPIFIAPLCFAMLPRFTMKQAMVYTVAISLMLIAGAIYSSSFLYHNLAFYIEEYRTAHVLPTPAEGDHIRFSMSIALFIVWCFYLWPSLGKGFKWFVGITIGILTLYLHILAAKSGVVAFYLFIFSWVIYMVIAKRKFAAIWILALMCFFLFLAVKFIPTLNQRVGYISFTILYKSDDVTGDYGDRGRIMSYDIAWKLIKENPLTGVGAGDVHNAMISGYDRWYPLVELKNRLQPHNEFLTIGLAIGIPGLLLFAAWILMPLTWLKKNRESFFFFVTWLMLFIPLMVEPIFETQFGVFVYVFFLLWQKHTLTERRN